MKKLVKVEIENFQSHVRSLVNLSDFTVILGPTDSGKSAIIRAVKWCLYNIPPSANFIHFGKLVATVIAYFDDGTIVKRVKGKDINFYELTQRDGVMIHLESFGAGPVTEVLNFHGMREVVFGGSKQILNICSQLSEPFFLSGSSIDRAIMIGDIANTKIPDRAIKNIVAKIKDKKASLKVYKEELSDTKSSLKKYDYLPNFEKTLIKLNEMFEKFDELSKKRDDLNSLANSYNNLLKQKEKLTNIIALGSDIEIIIASVEKALLIYDDITKIQRIVDNYNKEIKKQEKLNNIIENISLTEIETIIEDIEKAAEKYKESENIKNISEKYNIDKKRKEKLEVISLLEVDQTIEQLDLCKQKLLDLENLKTLIKSYETNIVRKESCEKSIHDSDMSYENIITEYKDILQQNPHCPICMSEITNEGLERIGKFL